MDPFLEPHWLDVHSSLIIEARNILNNILPPDLVARAEERIAVESDDLQAFLARPDVQIVEPRAAASGSAASVVAAPFTLVAMDDPIIERFIRIVTRGEGRLITVIEFVSPTNKTGRGLNEYMRKRGELVEAGVNVVEIDLVRAGDWRAMLLPLRCPAQAVTPYRAIVRPGGEPRKAGLFPIGLRDRLPEIPVPLRGSDEHISLPLQPLVEKAYAGGRYAQTIDYSLPLQPPLEAAEALWVESILKSSGKIG